jgi:hypothetical protein
MKDQQLERDIRAALLRDEPPAMSVDLRRRVAEIPGRTVPSPAGRRPLRLSTFVGPARALVALAAVVALVAALVYLRGSNVGPAPSGRASSPVGASSTPGATASATGMASASATASAPAAWRGLEWSTPGTLQDAFSVTDVVAWHGELVAVGLVRGATAEGQVAFWRSTDGKAWTRMSVNAAAFDSSSVNALVATPSRLVAWGWAGEPVCIGEGAGTTCEPRPAMIWTSANGLTWTWIDPSPFKGATIVGVASDGRGLIAAGYLSWSEPAIWTSTTGSTWQRQSLSPATFQGAHFSDVRAMGAGYFLAGSVGGSEPGGVRGGTTGGSSAEGVAAAWRSPDGLTWTAAPVQRSGDVGVSLGTIHVGASGMVAVGSASGGNIGAAWSSTDGRSWQPLGLAYYGAAPAPTGVPTLPALGVADDGTHLVAYGHGSSGLAMWLSSDGATWQPLPFSGALDAVPEAPGETPGASVAGVFVVPDGLVVVGQAGSATQVPIWHVLAQT